MTTPALVEHFFRHEYGRLVATLSRRVGVQYIEAIEDAVQSALMSALERWTYSKVPDNPSAWLYRVASNQLLGELRQRSGHRRILEKSGEQVLPAPKAPVDPLLGGDLQDDLLRMLFVLCDDMLPIESQLVFALKILCGFSIREISLRLFTSEANVYKRFSRARNRLRALPGLPEAFTHAQYTSRLPSVNKVLYLLFTEGYLSSHATQAIRQELCQEAIRLTSLLAEHPAGQHPETFALLALMYLHKARMASRQDGAGGLLFLEEQDRSLWNAYDIQKGLTWLANASQGDHFSRYHAEAGIAAEHCLSPSFQETCWERVAENYALLESIAPSAIHRLNRAVAVAEWKGPKAGLALLEDFAPPTWLTGSYMWSAIMADLHKRCGHIQKAKRFKEVALQSAPSPVIRTLLQRRLENKTIN